ncbi:MAG: LysM peptidoglycan-binding domain-containing protein [Anaerolineae bacterium]|nr:LysM peptidoglycan-binding domain-containing protein [Anaerolineae bacterium]
MSKLGTASALRGMGARRFAWLATLLLCALFLPATPVHAQAQIHVVSAGETLSSIATRYGTTAAAIASANGLSNPNLIYAGQRLTIPASSAGSAPAGGSYVVRAGDTLASIAARHGTTAAAIAAANGLANPNYIYPGQQLRIPTGGTAASAPPATGALNHVVSRGETLSSIAARYGTTAAAIAAANGLANPNTIYAGQRLQIPAAGAASAPAPATTSSRRIVVDLSDQRMYVYQDGQILWNWIVSTGRPGQETAVGHYQVLNKLPNAYAYTWGLQMPYWLGIYWAGHLQNGIHALPIQGNGQRLWEGYLGQRVSYGCVILSTENAATLYNWATVGTPVDIIW